MSTLNAFCIFLLCFIFCVINTILILIVNKRIKRCMSLNDAISSKLNDVQLINSDVLRRIERRCDAIDQRTKAHLNTKKRNNKRKDNAKPKQSTANRTKDRSLF